MRAFHAAILLLGLLATQLSATPSAAQGTTWNRHVTGIGLAETAVPGSYDVTAHFGIIAGGASSSVPNDAGTELELRVNSATIATGVVAASATSATPGVCTPAACGGTCGGGSFGGTSADLTCESDGAGGCDCSSPPLAFTFPAVPLAPGDEIMILLRPAPGALPDPDPGDDIGILDFGSWNRTLESIDVEPDPAGPGSLIRANFRVSLSSQNTLPLPMDTRVTFEQNATTVGDEIMVILFPAPGAAIFCADVGCGSGVCGEAEVNGAANDMFCDPVECDCRLLGLSIEIFTPTPVLPSDEVTVILKPAPGALPELPGFGDDEMMRPAAVPSTSPAALFALGAALGGALLWRRTRRRAG